MWNDEYKRLFFSEQMTEESTLEGFKLKLEKLATPFCKSLG